MFMRIYRSINKDVQWPARCFQVAHRDATNAAQRSYSLEGGLLYKSKPCQCMRINLRAKQSQCMFATSAISATWICKANQNCRCSQWENNGQREGANATNWEPCPQKGNLLQAPGRTAQEGKRTLSALWCWCRCNHIFLHWESPWTSN